jgi:hypothetical protein
MTTEVGYFVGEGGGKPIRMTLPLPKPMQQQLTKGYLRRVNQDGTPYRQYEPEPSAENTGGDRPPPAAEPPAESALKAEWVGHAVRAHGLTPDAAEAMTKADLIERFGRKPGA